MSDHPETRARIVGTPGHEAVYIGDHLIPCTAAKLDMAVEHLPVLTLTLPIAHGLDVDSVAKVRVDEPTRELLVSLGWVPPERVREAVAKGEISINAARAFHGLPPFEYLPNDGEVQS